MNFNTEEVYFPFTTLLPDESASLAHPTSSTEQLMSQMSLEGFSMNNEGAKTKKSSFNDPTRGRPDPSDPLSQLDPLWSMKQQQQ